ncbi:MAG: glycine--tRNA ligase subunit beta [Sulfurimonas sp.]|jgi:glycyl-tRNA synthetase beta chain|nr:glycine--tRNA ligase subunit beta [Sulfurimonadaceae bacterium]
MNQPLLIEIGLEELPAIPLLKELTNIEKKYATILEKYNLFSDFEFYYTPRRLVIYHNLFKLTQDDSEEEFFGAPLSVAYKDGVATPAAIGFAKKCGVELDELKSTIKDDKEVLYFKKEIKGKDSKELIGSMVKEWLDSLDFGKSMRWGSYEESFIRPLRWICGFFANEVLDIELFGIRSSNATFVHRGSSFNAIKVDGIKGYFETLKDGGVELFASKRKESILEQFKALEEKNGIKIEQDSELLDEVVAITEYPSALLGSFDEEFLTLPPEVIITSMKEHQRYFPVFKDDKLINRFVVVSNAMSSDFSKVVEGNERVLRPRLSDGLFFYENDLKRGLSTDGLEKIVFMKGLGSVADKIERERVVAKELCELFGGVDKDELDLVIKLAKADLLSEMVYEFTELQGVMGYYYAKALGYSQSVAVAIKEQYLPNKEDGDLPSTRLSAIVAMSIKLDTLMGLFSIEQIPTGSRDPFALRRAVNGVVRIVHEFGFSFDIRDILKNLAKNYNNFDTTKLEEFFLERLRGYYRLNPSILEAIFSSGDRELLSIAKKVEALVSITSSSDFADYFSTFKRVANITKDIDLSTDLTVDSSLFSHEAEGELFRAYNLAISKTYISYEEELDALFALKPELDSFFEHVMVNVEDELIKNNRKALIGLIYKSLANIAEIKLLSF